MHLNELVGGVLLRGFKGCGNLEVPGGQSPKGEMWGKEGGISCQ